MMVGPRDLGRAIPVLDTLYLEIDVIGAEAGDNANDADCNEGKQTSPADPGMKNWRAREPTFLGDGIGRGIFKGQVTRFRLTRRRR